MNPTALRSRQCIVEAMLAMLSEQPFDEIRISELSMRADLTRQTFYQNFSSKIEVLNYYLDQLFEQFFMVLQNKQIHTPKELTYQYFSFWEQHEEFLLLIIKNNLSGLITTNFPVYLNRLLPQKWDRDENTNLQMQQYANVYISGALANILIFWINDRKRLSIEEIVNIIDAIHAREVIDAFYSSAAYENLK